MAMFLSSETFSEVDKFSKSVYLAHLHVTQKFLDGDQLFWKSGVSLLPKHIQDAMALDCPLLPLSPHLTFQYFV